MTFNATMLAANNMLSHSIPTELSRLGKLETLSLGKKHWNNLTCLYTLTRWKVWLDEEADIIILFICDIRFYINRRSEECGLDRRDYHYQNDC